MSAGMTRVEIVYPFRTAVDLMSKPCRAVTVGWCQAPWTCSQPCTGRGGNSAAMIQAQIGAGDADAA